MHRFSVQRSKVNTRRCFGVLTSIEVPLSVQAYWVPRRRNSNCCEKPMKEKN